MKSKEQAEQELVAVKAERAAGVEPGYEQGYIDGVYTALTWVLDLEVTAEQVHGLL